MTENIKGIFRNPQLISTSQSTIPTSKEVKWQASEAGWLKFNVNSSTVGNPGPVELAQAVTSLNFKLIFTCNIVVRNRIYYNLGQHDTSFFDILISAL
ncbi:hypothetical protein POUND7_010004 [Theobroma cacao]